MTDAKYNSRNQTVSLRRRRCHFLAFWPSLVVPSALYYERIGRKLSNCVPSYVTTCVCTPVKYLDAFDPINSYHPTCSLLPTSCEPNKALDYDLGEFGKQKLHFDVSWIALSKPLVHTLAKCLGVLRKQTSRSIVSEVLVKSKPRVEIYTSSYHAVFSY